MRTKDVVIGKYYRHKDHPNYAWARAMRVIEPHKGVNFTVVECEWTLDKNADFGLIKYFRPSYLIEDVKGG